MLYDAIMSSRRELFRIASHIRQSFLKTSVLLSQAARNVFVSTVNDRGCLHLNTHENSIGSSFGGFRQPHSARFKRELQLLTVRIFTRSVSSPPLSLFDYLLYYKTNRVEKRQRKKKMTEPLEQTPPTAINIAA